jgi:Glycosyltransferase
MKKIYWIINQYQKIGGSEIVSSYLANSLAKECDLTVVLLSNDEINYDLYNVDENLKIIKLNIDKEIIRNEDYLSKPNFFKKFVLVLKLIHINLLGKYKYRRFIKKMTTNEDIIICSSPFSYLIAPRGRKVIFHLHYNSRYFTSFSNKFLHTFFYIKLTKYVFLTKETMEKMKHKNDTKAIYINNPAKFKREQILATHKKLKIVFIARYEQQKRPLKAIEVLGELAKKTTNFKASFYGGGYYFLEMVDKVKELNLTSLVKVHDTFCDAKKVLSDSDVLILTSEFEGFQLSVIEAASLSVPTISYDFGDGIDDVINNEKTGFIIPYNDKEKFVEKLLFFSNNQEELIQFKKNAYLFSKKFEIDRIKEEWLNLFNLI